MTNESLPFAFVREGFRRFLVWQLGRKSAMQDDRELVGHGDQRDLAALYAQSPKPFLQHGILARGCRPGAFHQRSAHPAIAACGRAALVLTRADAIARSNSDPRTKLAFAREHVHGPRRSPP